MHRPAIRLTQIRRSVSARLVERFIFNFRLSPNSLAERLPVSWLKPQVANGWSVVSFCILRIERLMLRPLPAQAGLETTCCAYRCGVIDCSEVSCNPSVYILGRYTDSQFVTFMAPSIFQSEMPPVRADIDHTRRSCTINVRFGDGRPLFAARVFPSEARQQLRSKAFASLHDFIDFIKNGVSSYARSTAAGQYSRIDLYKEDAGYESMDAAIEFSKLDYEWDGSGLEFDSVVRAGGGGMYVWTYKGKVPADSKENRSLQVA
jgi:hypothetical protein